MLWLQGDPRSKSKKILQDLLLESVPENGENAVVCWGFSYEGDLPALNRQAGKDNKLTQLRKLRDVVPHVNHVPFYVPVMAHGGTRIFPSHYPVLGRHLRHQGGRDIKICYNSDDIACALQTGSRFFTLYIPWVREFRYWIFRGSLLGTYEKHYIDSSVPAVKIATRKNGYKFVFCPLANAPIKGKKEAIKAIQAVNLDFGAVDVIEDNEGKFWVLEINTAPGVEGPRAGISNLAKKVCKWYTGGCSKNLKLS